jgi:predicted nucleic acid-binding protein
MVLADTSVWVTHLRKGESRLVGLLNEGEILIHPYVIGELALGNLGNRAEVLGLLQALPTVVVAEHDEIMEFVLERNLVGKGLGYVDVHLLASALLSNVGIWTLDRTLRRCATELGCDYHP